MLVNMYDVQEIRSDFPILNRVLPNGKPLVYFDTVSYTHLTLPTINWV